VAALVVMGALLCAGTLFLLFRQVLRIRRAVRTEGVVVHIETVLEAWPVGIFDRALVPRDAPHIQFTTADGVDIVARLPTTSTGGCWCGQRVSCLYVAHDLRHVVRSRSDYWLDFILILLIGTFCFVSVIWLR
jgi:hypothetical protein